MLDCILKPLLQFLILIQIGSGYFENQECIFSYRLKQTRLKKWLMKDGRNKTGLCTICI